MTMEKLLHERLREWIDSDYAMQLKDVVNAEQNGKGYIYRAIADEIERCYIPRPRFEDGEPVEWGADGICWDNDESLYDSWYFNAIGKRGEVYATSGNKIVSRAEINEYGFVKRPTPKVYDADGVAYERGETVFDIETGEEKTVEDLDECAVRVKGDEIWWSNDCFTHEKPVFDADGERIKVGDTVYDIKYGNESVVKRTDSCNSDGKPIICKDGCPGELWYKPEQLTHTEPVFDAEGVRICKGDTVWSKYGNKYTVEKVAHEPEVTDFGIVYFTDGGQMRGCDIYHREPDSLDKLRDDMKDVWENWTPKEMDGEWVDRLTALIERGA